MKKTMLSCLMILSLCLCGCTGVAKQADVDGGPKETAGKTDDAPVKDEKKPSEEKEWTSLDDDKEKGSDDTDINLKDVLMSKTGISMYDFIDFSQEDFDNDGSEEAFALTGEVIDDYDGKKLINGIVWFVKDKKAEKVTESGAMGFYDRFRTMTLGDTVYLMVDEVYATSIVTHVYLVDEGKVSEAPFSALGEVITDLDDDIRFRIMDSSYDMMYDDEMECMIGHTWKHYYFFYLDEEDKVYEYAGTSLSRDDAGYICGYDIVGKLIDPKDTITGMFLRGNGLLVINYEHPTDGGKEYYHYIYDMTCDHLVDDYRDECSDEPLCGICLESLCLDIANYPELPVQ